MSKTQFQSLAPRRFDSSLPWILFPYLGLNTQKWSEEPGNSDRGQVLGCKVPVEPLELVKGQEDTQQVDHDPQSVQDVVTIWTLKGEMFFIKLFSWFILAPGRVDTMAGECERLR